MRPMSSLLRASSASVPFFVNFFPSHYLFSKKVLTVSQINVILLCALCECFIIRKNVSMSFLPVASPSQKSCSLFSHHYIIEYRGVLSLGTFPSAAGGGCSEEKGCGSSSAMPSTASLPLANVAAVAEREQNTFCEA